MLAQATTGCNLSLLFLAIMRSNGPLHEHVYLFLTTFPGLTSALSLLPPCLQEIVHQLCYSNW